MIDYMFCLVVILLMDMPVKDHNIVVWHKEVDSFCAVPAGTVPWWIEIEQGPAGEDHYPGSLPAYPGLRIFVMRKGGSQERLFSQSLL